jgi:TIR domain
VARIFLNYRRDDSRGDAGRLYDRLSQHFGRTNLFMDVDTIALGLDFVEAIQDAVGSCDVLLAVIGRLWLASTDKLGHRRLDDPKDFVRLEIMTALERKIRVIPVLVDGASMPRSTELPDVLQPLASLQALVVGDRFHPDVDHLIKTLDPSFTNSKGSRQFLASLATRCRHRAKARDKAHDAELLDLHSHFPIQWKISLFSDYLAAWSCWAVVAYIFLLVPSPDYLARLPLSIQIRVFCVVLALALFYGYIGAWSWRDGNRKRRLLRGSR